MRSRLFNCRIGSMIRLKRRRALLTMAALGKKVKGLSKGYLSGIEQGKVGPPGWKMAQRLAVALEFPVDDFASLCELVKMPEAVFERPRIKEEIEVLFKACGEEVGK